MLKRFYCPNLASGEIHELESREAHHAYSVLRKRAGDELELFDGKGREARAKILQVSKKQLKVQRGELAKKEPYPLEIHLAQAVPHRKKLDDIVEKCEELAVSKIILLKSEHTVFNFEKKSFEKMLTRLELGILEGAKQSRNNYLMTVEGWKTSHEIIDNFREYDRVFLASPAAVFKNDPFEELNVKDRHLKILILIGPEGGFSPAEEKKFIAGKASAITLGSILLKCDTAAVASISMLKFAFEGKWYVR